MTHHIISINDYLHQTHEIAKKNKVKKAVVFFTFFMALLSFGFGIYSSADLNQKFDNQSNTSIIEASEANQLKLGKVYIAFDPAELDGVENVEEFLKQKDNQQKTVAPTIEQDHDFLPEDWSQDEVRNRIIIKGNYYAIHE